MKTDAKDSAFPLTYSSSQNHGLTKREYFASMAMQGILQTAPLHYLKFSFESIIPRLAIEYADMLIEELNKNSSA